MLDEDDRIYSPYEEIPLDDDNRVKLLMDSSDPIGAKKKPLNIIEFTDTNTEFKNASKESINAITDLYSHFNKKYGLSLSVNVESISAAFGDIVEPRNKHIFKIYLSEAFDRFSLVMYQRMMLFTSTLMENITTKLDPNTPIETQFIMLEKVFMYMEKINQINATMASSFNELELEKLSQAEEGGAGTNNLNYSDPDIIAVINKLNNTILKKNTENE